MVLVHFAVETQSKMGILENFVECEPITMEEIFAEVKSQHCNTNKETQHYYAKLLAIGNPILYNFLGKRNN